MAVIYVDMDNVLVDFKSGMRKFGLPDDAEKPDNTPGIFSAMDPMPGAVAGFNKDDVEVEYEDNLLTVKTKKTDKAVEKNVDGEIIHKGISQRSFSRSFTIADDVKVNGAQLKDGLLTVSCEKIIPEPKKRKLIPIK